MVRVMKNKISKRRQKIQRQRHVNYETALRVVAKRACKSSKAMQEIVESLRADSLKSRQSPEPRPAMTMTRDDVLRLFEFAGWTTAKGWPNGKMALKLHHVPMVLRPEHAPRGELGVVWERVLETIENKGSFKVVGS